MPPRSKKTTPKVKKLSAKRQAIDPHGRPEAKKATSKSNEKVRKAAHLKKKGHPTKTKNKPLGAARKVSDVKEATDENPLSFLYDSPIQSQSVASSQPDTEKRPIITVSTRESLTPTKMKSEIGALQAKVNDQTDCIATLNRSIRNAEANLELKTKMIRTLKDVNTELRKGFDKAHSRDIRLQQLLDKVDVFLGMVEEKR